MKRSLPNCVVVLLVCTVCFLSSAKTAAQVYSTRANGNWTSVSTWASGLVPPAGTINPSVTININHSVVYNGNTDIKNHGTIYLMNLTGTIPVLTIPTAVNFENKATGKFYIKDAEYRQYRFAGGGNSGTAQSGSFSNKGGYVEISNSIVEVAEKWTNEAAGKRIFKKGLLLTGSDYELKDINSLDTLDKVAVSIGWHNNGDFKISDGKIVFNQAKIQLAGTNSKLNFNSGTGCGDIDYITFKNHATSAVNTGDLYLSPSLTTAGVLNLDAYCVSAPSKFQCNNKFSGAQSADCSLNYFPSGFLIQQTNNLSAGLSFTNPQPVGAPSLGVGGKYKFALVNDTTDAIVTIDSLVHGATVASIDDNTSGTGYAFAFQPRISSGNLVGRSYAVFTISFMKAGTMTPVSLNQVNATPLDIDGGTTLKEFAEVTMGDGGSMSYMSSSTDIALLPLAPGSYGAQNVLGIERSNIDTASYNNMFSVFNTDVSSFSVKYGSSTSVPTNSTRQFSLYMKGFEYAFYSLPVTISSFTVTLDKDDKAHLKWSCDTETDITHYMVERSVDGQHFTDAGKVFSVGNTTFNTDYEFKDDVSSVKTSLVYYRLRYVNKDEQFKYTTIRILRISRKEDNTITIITYPNPVSNEVRITIPAAWQQKKVVYELFGISGQVARRMETTRSNQTETMQISSLHNGIYIIKASCEGKSVQQRIVKQ